ncbi:unnamed protein product [Prorocentrum cordatum]|uniref:Uncharacterized protein n=1 Tax=Prorocentrum cordatum TaxID=2364126 RepID=A0ABN9PG53_9DINO|nr:unnamed protein product [Polarella glacialis]
MSARSTCRSEPSPALVAGGASAPVAGGTPTPVGGTATPVGGTATPDLASPPAGEVCEMAALSGCRSGPWSTTTDGVPAKLSTDDPFYPEEQPRAAPIVPAAANDGEAAPPGRLPLVVAFPCEPLFCTVRPERGCHRYQVAPQEYISRGDRELRQLSTR